MILQYEKEFKTAVDVVIEKLGPKPFHLYAGFNSSAFDAVVVAVSRHEGQVPDDFRDRWIKLADSHELREAVSGGTTDVDQVRGRLSLIEERLFDD